MSNLDPRFFALMFDPFFACVLLGKDCDQKALHTHEIMVQRISKLPGQTQKSVLAGLQTELQRTKGQLTKITDPVIKAGMNRKVDAIVKILKDFS